MVVLVTTYEVVRQRWIYAETTEYLLVECNKNPLGTYEVLNEDFNSTLS
jgi:hypothetical protein